MPHTDSPRTGGPHAGGPRTGGVVRAGVLLLTLVAAGPARAADAIQARLTAVDNEGVRLDKGQSDGVSEGQIFDVYRDREVFYLPLTANTVPLVRPQKLVARVRVVACEASSARATVVERFAETPGAPPPVLEKNLAALLNPKAVAPNLRPTFHPDRPKLAAAPWRGRIPISWKVDNDPGEPIMFAWSTTGGTLAEPRTLQCSNVWIAPPEPGEYQVTIEATDAAGNVAREALTVTSTGMPERFPLRQFTVRQRYGAGSQYGQVRDLAFDALGRRFVLEQGKGGLLSSGRYSVRVDLAPGAMDRIPSGDRSLGVIAVSNPRQQGTRWVPGALFVLDTDRRAVLRFGFGPAWNRVMEQEPMVLGNTEGGAGNGRFVEPVDLAVTPDGERVLVLDAGQRCVQVYGQDGVFLLSFGRPGSGPLALKRPRALAVGPRGTVYVLDAERRVVIAYRDFSPVSEFEVGAVEDEPVGLAVDPFDGAVYVLDKASGWIKRFQDGRLAPPHYIPQPGELGRLSQPTRLRMDPTRVLWTVDREGGSLVRIDALTMTVLGRTGGIELKGPLKVAGQPDGGSVALDTANGIVTSFDARGWAVARFGGEGEAAGQFGEAVDLAVTRAGLVCVLDATRQQVLTFSPQGRFNRAVGRPGEGPRDLRGALDLNVTPDRRYLVVLQQRESDNFNLLDPNPGREGSGTLLTFGRDYADDQTASLGCVTGGGEGQKRFLFWTLNDDRDHVLLTRLDQLPSQLPEGYESVSDMEANVAGFVFVCDQSDGMVRALSPDGTPALEIRSEVISDPRDLGVDDYGRLYIYDHSTREVVELSE